MISKKLEKQKIQSKIVNNFISSLGNDKERVMHLKYDSMTQKS